MHILFLSDNFPPEVNAPASRTFEHCREWVKAGHQVTVITCAPNFPKGCVFAGYKNKLWQREEMDGIRVIRVWSYITANEGFLRRTIDYVSYMVSAILAAPFVRKADLVIGTSPQFFTACAAYTVSTCKCIPFVFEIRDLWPDSIKAVGAMKDGFLLRCLEWLERFLYRKADRIITVTNSFKNNLIIRGIDSSKIEVITNGVDTTRFQPCEKDPGLVARLGLEGKFVAGYIGTHGMAHALGILLEAAKKLQQRSETGFIHFLFLGDGAKKKELMNRAEDLHLRNVVFVDSVPKDEVVRYWSLLDVSIIHLRKTDLFTTVIPSKLFECMGMGVPVLHGVSGESAAIVKRENIGIIFKPENTDQLCNALNELAHNGQLYKELRLNCLGGAKKYDRRMLAQRMLAILDDTAQRTKHGVRMAQADK